MSDIIHLLPDSVANQIAAGEVIQRPASVIKELVENALDAGATSIQVIVKGAGRTSIQVIDNGKGMSETDARLSFERHATSKIQDAADLFNLRTMGFRGEALASIAAIAHVELKTRQASEDIGTVINIAGSEIESQEPCSCAVGTSITVKDLFYNVPARRKFLKSDETEMRNILQEMQRIVLINPEVQFQLYQGSDIIYELQSGSFKQRITGLFGKKNRNINQQLLTIEANTNLVNIKGYVGKPESATKSSSQFFFVNNRYMYHPYFRKAVLQAYDRMIQPDTTPPFFIDIQVDPSTIDVNIHPTKTEIKFENEREIWSILTICIKEALGKFNVIPAIDFDTEGKVDMPFVDSSRTINQMPSVSVNPNYNPFNPPTTSSSVTPDKWQPLYEESIPKFSPEESYDYSQYEQSVGLTPRTDTEVQIFPSEQEHQTQTLFSAEPDNLVFQYKKRYICTAVKSGMMFIDIKRAQMRLYYDDLIQLQETKNATSQQLLFPEVLELSPEDHLLFTEIELDLDAIGFKLEPFGKYAYVINAIPALLPNGSNPIAILEDLLLHFQEKDSNIKYELNSLIALSISKAAVNQPIAANLSTEEMNHIIGRLFTSSNPNFTADGKRIVNIISDDDINQGF